MTHSNAYISYCTVTILKLPPEQCRVVDANKVIISPWNVTLCYEHLSMYTVSTITYTLVAVRWRDC